MIKILKIILAIIIGFQLLARSKPAFFIYLAVILYFLYKKYKPAPTQKNTPIKETPHSINLELNNGTLLLSNPFRGLFVVGSAGSGKSESIAVPLLQEFIKKNYCGVVYDFKFPTLANEIENISYDKQSTLKRYFISFDTNYHSNKINPIAIMTNNLYRINLLDNTSNLKFDILILMSYSIILIFSSYIFLRRRQFDSI